MSSQKAVIYIGGSKPQIPGIKAAKRAGLYTVVTDISENAPGTRHADQYARISATDTRKLLSLASDISNRYQLTGCYGIADYAYEAIGAINEKFGLPGGSREVYERTTNKWIAKQLWHNNGLPVANAFVMDENDRISETIQKIKEQLSLPVIFKPVDSYNAQGVTLVTELNPLKVRKAVEFSLRYSRRVLCEQYVSGRHINTDILMIEGKGIPVVCTERLFYDPAGRQNFCGYQPADLCDDTENQLYNLVENAAKCIGLFDGPVTADIVITDAGPRLLELSPHYHSLFTTSIRDGGNSIHAWFQYLARKTVKNDFFKDDSHAAGYCCLSGSQEQIENMLSENHTNITIVDRDIRPLKGDCFMNIVWLKADTAEMLRSALMSLEKKAKEMIKTKEWCA